MLECMFESRLGLESSGFSMWHFLKLVARIFFQGTPVSSPPSSVNGSANKIKLKLDVLHVVCTRLRPGHLSVRVGDGSLRSEEIV